LIEHDIMTTNEPILMREKGMKWLIFGVRRSKVKVTWGRR